VQTSLLQAQVFMLDFQAARWLMDREVPGQAGNDHPTSIPTGVFETSDGYINIACAGQAMWLKFKALFGDPAFDDPDFADPPARSKNRKKLNALINAHTRKHAAATWIGRLNEAGIPCGEINTIDKVFDNPQVKHLGLAAEVVSQERGPTQMLAQPIKMSRSKSAIRQPPPLLGQHSAEVLTEAGYTPGEIDQLLSAGIILAPEFEAAAARQPQARSKLP
jgi:crotonobetainyl-CoA:carnitine CoA-transferase CaiB-like acyl-CoA transferase